MGGRPEGKRDSTSGAPPPLAGFERISEGAFHHRMQTTMGLAVVLFTAPHCSACRAWKHLLLAALADMNVRFYDVDVGEATGVARYFDIFHLPTIYLYRDGRFHAQLQCEPRPEVVRAAALALWEAAAEDEPG